MNNTLQRMSIIQKINVFYQTVQKLGYIPTSKKRLLFDDGTKMHTFWCLCKTRNRFDKDIYKKLLELDILKIDYNNYISEYQNT